MLYAVIGIPLCLVMFQSVGERLNNFASWCIKTIKKGVKLRHYESTQTELVIVGTVLAVGVVTGGAAMFHHYESWSYFNCVYYCFITLTTIGKRRSTINSSYFFFCLKKQTKQNKKQFLIYRLR
jgi:potassium channel subfamily K member 9